MSSKIFYTWRLLQKSEFGIPEVFIGNPVFFVKQGLLDSRFRGNDRLMILLKEPPKAKKSNAL
jgi:hypothetical protein